MRRLATALLLLLALPVTAAEPDRALEGKLQMLWRQSYDRPERVNEEIDRLERDTANATQLDAILFARARIRIAEGDMRGALAIADQLGRRPGLEARAELLRATVNERSGQIIEAEQEAMRVRDLLARPCGVAVSASDGQAHLAPDCDFRVMWYALRIIGEMHANSGAFSLAESTARYALELAQAGGDAYLAAQVQSRLALIAQRQGQLDTARHWLAEAIQTAQGDYGALARAHDAEAAFCSRTRDLPCEYRAIESALEAARKADEPHYIAFLQANLTDYYMANGQPAEAMRLGQQALPVLVKMKDRDTLRVLYHNMAIALIELKRLDDARVYLAKTEEMRGGLSDTEMRVTELTELGEALAGAGQAREALRVYREERQLTAQSQAHAREAALQQVRTRFDSDRKQRELDLLRRDTDIKNQQLDNQQLAQKLGIAIAGFTALSLVLIVVMLLRVRQANRQLRSRQALLRVQSERDPLTDLANRRLFLALMENHASTTFRGALLMVDIDHFKRVNDEHGHGAGDAVIAEVARRLGRTVRNEDIVVRWGGEEFLIYVPGMPQWQLQQMAERILQVVGAEPVQTGKSSLHVTVSIGFVYFPLPPNGLELHWERAVNWADMALYMAKAMGRNRAIGVVTVRADDAGALVEIEADFDAACSSERVKLLTLIGPPQA